MNNDVEVGWKDVVATEAEIKAMWKKLICDFQANRVCFYPGAQDNGPGFENFVDAVRQIGTCDVLVFCEPRLSKAQVREQVERFRAGPQLLVAGVGAITAISIVTPENMPDEDHRALFGQLGTEWVPVEAKPQDDRFWGLYSRLTFANREVHLLHIGLAGDAAWAHFLQPNHIHPARIIMAPRDRIVANPPFRHGQ